MTPSPRLVPSLTTAALLLALAGCGGSSGGSGATATSSPTPKALTAAEAKTAAAAAVLTTDDLPGYKVEAQTDDPDDKKNDAEFHTCLGVPSPTYLASDPGRSFTKGDLEVDSSADVAETVVAAKAEIAAYTGPKSDACSKAQLVKIFAKEGATITSFTQTPMTLSVPGSDAVFGYQISLDAAGNGQTLQMRGFDLGALVGQVEVAISVFGTPETNLTVAQAQALLVKATERLKTAL